MSLPELNTGAPCTQTRWFCGFVAVFWLSRLVVQLFLFDARPYLKTAFLKLGYHGLTVVFTYLGAVYAWAAVRGLAN